MRSYLVDRLKEAAEAALGAVVEAVPAEMLSVRIQAQAAAAAAAGAGKTPTTAAIQALETAAIQTPVPGWNYAVNGAAVALWGAGELLGYWTKAPALGEIGEGIGLPGIAGMAADLTHSIRAALSKSGGSTASRAAATGLRAGSRTNAPRGAAPPPAARPAQPAAAAGYGGYDAVGFERG